MQFLPATFATYGVTTGPSARPDIADPADAIYSAANYLVANGAADPDRLPAAPFAYNHSPTYVHLVLAKAGEYAATPPPPLAGNGPAGGDVQAVMDLAGQGRIGLAPEAAADLPSTDPRLVALMLEIGRRHSYTVSVIRTGHARCVDATRDDLGCRESNHHASRALDITVVAGQPVSPTSTAARDLAAWLASLTGPLRPDEVVSPWANPTPPPPATTGRTPDTPNTCTSASSAPRAAHDRRFGRFPRSSTDPCRTPADLAVRTPSAVPSPPWRPPMRSGCRQALF